MKCVAVLLVSRFCFPDTLMVDVVLLYGADRLFGCEDVRNEKVTRGDFYIDQQ